MECLAKGLLAGKRAWITGAGTGIGEASAHALAGAGMNVVLSGRRSELLDSLAKEIGERATTAPLDVSDQNAVAAVAEKLIADFGRIDVLVNSAGINVKERNWHNVTLEDWNRVIRIDLDGAFYCAKAVLGKMIDQGDGLIINISSWAGKQVGTDITEYCRVLVERGFHVLAFSGLGTVDVLLDDFGDCVIFVHVGGRISHCPDSLP